LIGWLFNPLSHMPFVIVPVPGTVLPTNARDTNTPGNRGSIAA
jgi:hypothetical protein